MNFKLWSELNPKAKKELKPDFGFRNWNSLTEDEVYKVWKYLEYYFFDKDIKEDYNEGYYYKFYEEYQDPEQKKERILYSITDLNHKYKVKSYAKIFFENGTLNSACHDFYEIFMTQDENVVIELLSLYCRILISERADENMWEEKNETKEEYQKRLQNWRWEDFDEFVNIL